MQRVGSNLLAVLQSDQRDLTPVDLYEFYPPDETDLCPENAEKRFAASGILWFGWFYERQAISRGDISRFIDGKFNNVSITLSNVDREVSTWLSTVDLEGYRVLIRCVSRSVDDDSIVLGVFRCERVDEIDNTSVRISAKQDLGSIENDLPWNTFQPKCPLKFKGVECLGGQSLGSKSSAYQAATTCNKSWRQCDTDYSNGPAFQGIRFTAVTGNFKVSQRRGGAGGALLGLLGLGNKRVTKQYSSQEGSAHGQAVPLGLGRTQVELLPIVYADTGQYLAGQWMVGEGELAALLNVRNITAGWATSFQAYADHMGAYGYDSEQDPQGFFTSTGARYSHRAWVEATILGENPDTGDPAPSLAATVLWIKIPIWNGSSFAGAEWSDNPVEHLRYLLTESRSLGYNSAWIDDVIAGATAEYCNEPLIDQSGGEDFYVSTGSGTPGVDFKRYRSTGLLDTYYFRKVLGLTSQYSAEREVTYNTFDPANPGSQTPGTYYRKRYTSNWYLRERIKAVDFIFKKLLPAFRGYLVTGADGKLQIRTEKPTVTSYLRNNASAGATAIHIEDAAAWQALNLSAIYVLIGAGLSTSETRRVTSIQYSTAGNSITLAASGSGTASGSTLSGGTTSVQAQGYVTIGSVAACTITIDGTAVSYTPGADDTTGTIAAIMATRINANTTLNRFVRASWTPTLPNQVLIRSKLGTLNLASGLTSSHDQLEIAAHVHMPFSDVAFGALTRGNILADSFRYPLASKQSSYNRFTINFADAVNDYQPTQLNENDEDHQEKINKVNALEVGGDCIDNYHQASRIVVAARYKHREGDYFTSLSSTGLALLLEEGDVYCVSHSSMPGKRNLMMRVEELRIAQNHRVNVVGRLYADDQFPQSAEERTISLNTGVGWVSTPPGAITNLALVEVFAGNLQGSFDFAAYIGTQQARLAIKYDGDADFTDTGQIISPDAIDGRGYFQIISLPAGTHTIKLTPFSVAGDGPATEAVWGGGYGTDYGGSYGG
jgi:hypothetical protein